MEKKVLSQAQLDLLNLALPAEAVTPHPSKKFLSSIKSIYVTERLNKVFGVGSWHVKSEVVENHEKMVVVKVLFTVPDYGINYECYGGNDNPDRGDAYKGATTDALTKIGSWLGIGADVFKSKHNATAKTAQAKPERTVITSMQLDNEVQCNKLLDWIKAERVKHSGDFDIIAFVRKHYEIDDRTATRLVTLYNIHAK